MNIKQIDVVVKNQDDENVELSSFLGGWLVLYFYPKDDTPGCTVQACSFRDANSELLEMGAQVVGVSMDDVDSHQSFRAKHQLNFTLLSDSSGGLIKAFGAQGEDGKEGISIQRKTFIINPTGDIVKTYDNVTPQGHGSQVIEDLRALQDEQFNS